MAVQPVLGSGGRKQRMGGLVGTAELAEDAGKWLPGALSHKYLGQDPPPEPDEVTRVIVRVIQRPRTRDR